MKRLGLIVLALSTSAWSGNLVVTISPIVPPQCAAFVADVDVTAVKADGTTMPVGKLTGKDLVPSQLSQVHAGTKVVQNITIRRFRVAVSNAMCTTVNGNVHQKYLPGTEQLHLRVGSTTVPVVLLVDFGQLSNTAVRPLVKRLNIAQQVVSTTKAGSLNGLIVGADKKSVTIITQ
jgi:hypothetical protein